MAVMSSWEKSTVAPWRTAAAVLPPVAGAILVAISVVLTVFAGLVPSRGAAKKDPVEALRSE